jgi:antirestriction protein ArdC
MLRHYPLTNIFITHYGDLNMSNKTYDAVAALVIEAMETETKWRKTWEGVSRLNCNAKSKKAYRGGNQLTTMISAHVHGFTSQLWLTFNQCKELGGNVKGQKGTPGIFFSTKEKESGDTYAFAKRYTVFNLEQTGITLPEPELRETLLTNPNEIPSALGVSVGEGNPAYNYMTDSITMPAPGMFESDDAYNSTLYHETIHATGAKSRCDRDMFMLNAFGSEGYAKEELVAELGSIFLCSALGVPYEIEQHASYLKSWTKAIKDDTNYLVTAMTQAQAATDYVLSAYRGDAQ